MNLLTSSKEFKSEVERPFKKNKSLTMDHGK